MIFPFFLSETRSFQRQFAGKNLFTTFVSSKLTISTPIQSKVDFEFLRHA